MTRRRETEDPQSCLNRAEAEEPIFVLLGRDASAPEAVRQWCRHRLASGKNAPGDAQIAEARSLAGAMETWRSDREKRLADHSHATQSPGMEESTDPKIGSAFNVGLQAELIEVAETDGYQRYTIRLCYPGRTVTPDVRASVNVRKGLEMPWERVRDLLCKALERDVLEALSIGTRSPEYLGEP